jgi:hypothetical protein
MIYEVLAAVFAALIAGGVIFAFGYWVGRSSRPPAKKADPAKAPFVSFCEGMNDD